MIRVLVQKVRGSASRIVGLIVVKWEEKLWAAMAVVLTPLAFTRADIADPRVTLRALILPSW